MSVPFIPPSVVYGPFSVPATVKRLVPVVLAAGIAALAPAESRAAGVLQPVGAAEPFEIRSHDVRVVVNNGFASTEVEQTFFNPNATDLEAVYRCPLPKDAALSEFSLVIDGEEVVGEVVEKDRAAAIYREEKAAGRDAGLASANDFHSFDFAVSPVRAQAETRVRYLYYQPIPIDTGVGRYLYPLEEGQTDAGLDFWSGSKTVKGRFSFSAEVKSAFPIDAVRIPSHAGANVVRESAESWRVEFASDGNESLDKDLVFYYRLADGLPGRLEVVPFRGRPAEPGSFMLVLTPGMDLRPIEEGTDWTFVVDVSGSMAAKMATLASGLERALGELVPSDRIRIVAFSDGATEVLGYAEATGLNVRSAIDRLARAPVGGGTNVFAGLDEGILGLDPSRTSALVLITDGVANTGPERLEDFERLLKSHDVRVFTAVLGNSANWPLMELVARTSRGFCMEVSNADDIAGRLILARSKTTHEALHDVAVEFDGVSAVDLTQAPTSLHRGEQLVLFGRYLRPGRGEVVLRAKISGEEREFRTAIEFPEFDSENPEIERLWAFARCRDLGREIRRTGEDRELAGAIVEIATEHSIVTDYTSMVVLSEERFEANGIDRDNAERVEAERAARDARAAQPAPRNFVQAPASVASAPALPLGTRSHGLGGGNSGGGGGGGAIDPVGAGIALALMAAGAAGLRRTKPEGGSGNGRSGGTDGMDGMDCMDRMDRMD